MLYRLSYSVGHYNSVIMRTIESKDEIDTRNRCHSEACSRVLPFLVVFVTWEPILNMDAASVVVVISMAMFYY